LCAKGEENACCSSNVIVVILIILKVRCRVLLIVRVSALHFRFEQTKLLSCGQCLQFIQKEWVPYDIYEFLCITCLNIADVFVTLLNVFVALCFYTFLLISFLIIYWIHRLLGLWLTCLNMVIKMLCRNDSENFITKVAAGFCKISN
jgi:hypothetical protein